MNKTELVAAMAKETNLSKKDVEAVLKSFTDVVHRKGVVYGVGAAGQAAVLHRPVEPEGAAGHGPAGADRRGWGRGPQAGGEIRPRTDVHPGGRAAGGLRPLRLCDAPQARGAFVRHRGPQTEDRAGPAAGAPAPPGPVPCGTAGQGHGGPSAAHRRRPPGPRPALSKEACG